jgi:hypothetical protein
VLQAIDGLQAAIGSELAKEKEKWSEACTFEVLNRICRARLASPVAGLQGWGVDRLQ